MSLLTFEHFQNHGHFVNPRVGEKQVCPAMLSNAQTTVDLHNHQYATNFLLHLEEASSLTSIVRLPFPALLRLHRQQVLLHARVRVRKHVRVRSAAEA